MRRLPGITGIALVVSAIAAMPAAGQLPSAADKPPVPLIPYEARNPRSPDGDKLSEPRRIAAVVASLSQPTPHKIVDVGSFTGEFLEAFLHQFPAAKGQWTEPVDNNRETAVRRLGPFGARVSYVIGCPGRDISLGCIPDDIDLLLSSWLTIHKDLAGIRKFHDTAYARLPSGGTVVIMDHAGGDPVWLERMAKARAALVTQGIAAISEGPPVHHPEYITPTQEEQLRAMRDAGFVDVGVIWTRLDTFLYTGRKP